MGVESRSIISTDKEEENIFTMLIRLVKEEDKKIRTILDKKDIRDEKWPSNKSCFWAAKFICGKDDTDGKVGKDYYPGYTLYLYGGHALDIYIGWNMKITYKMFSNSYVTRKNGGIRNKALDKVRKSKNKIKWTERGTKLAEGIFSTDDWEKIIDAFKDWAYGEASYKKNNVERMRECIIADYNVANVEINSEFYVFDVEAAEKIHSDKEQKDIEAKPDMMAVIKNKEGSKFCLIEYKCTEGATKGMYSFKEHFDKMVKYYTNSKYVEKIRILFENKCRLEVVEANSNITRCEIVFVISHISEEEKEGYVTRNTVITKLEELEKKGKNFKEHKNNIKIVIMDENREPRLASNDFMSFDEAIRKLKQVTVSKIGYGSR